jgi:Fe-S cluster assembly protein SufD
MNNRNLLLSDDAEIDSKPQLEIHADDVKCAHGVTVGQLSAESIFYLQSRGIDESSARNMLTFAFANEMVEKIRHGGHRQQVRDALLANLPQTDVRGDWL